MQIRGLGLIGNLLRGLDEDCSAIGQHLGDALHHFGRIVARADHRVAA